MGDLHATDRFSDRVEDDARYWPDYPTILLEWLRNEHGVRTDWPVPDIGAAGRWPGGIWLHLRGRRMPSSCWPPAGHPNRETMLAAVSDMFDAIACDDRTRFDYDTRTHVGTVN